MNTKNVYPRMVCDLNGFKSSFDMTKPTVTIGREPDNDLVFDHNSDSRHHAKITYDGYGFYITDLNSTNHVLVNGKMETNSVLRSADTIQLGQVRIIFYL